MEKKSAAAAAPAVQTLNCSICKEVVTAETYAEHIRAKHGAKEQEDTEWPQLPQGNMEPLRTPLNSKGLSGGHYLKGEDIPTGVNEVSFRLIQFIHDPKGRSIAAAQISETYGKKLFGFNTTNIRLVDSMGFSDLQQLVGKTISCVMGYQPNPQKNNLPTRAFFITKVE